MEKNKGKCEKRELSSLELDKISGGLESGDPFAESGVNSYDYDEEIKEKA